MRPILHFYHFWARGQWQQPLTEHVSALRESDLIKYAQVMVGLVGSFKERASAKVWLNRNLPEWQCVNESVDGYEQSTLTALREFIIDVPDNAAILYAHNKGSYDVSTFTTLWRQSMTKRTILSWKQCIDLLDEYDAVGCHWLTPEDYPDRVKTPFFGGNFWWSNVSFLRTLPPLSNESRYYAEAWIGFGNPHAFDLFRLSSRRQAHADRVR